ncbi:MAG: hypothetical protein JST30_09180 [Armatimonadetes bacterium]|nr:hypothetical protein [Armatimonadota bacterium]
MKHAAIALAVLLTATAHAQSYTTGPSDDIWAYGHALDGGTDPLLRVWGDGVTSYKSEWPAGDEWSYGYLRFPLAGIAPGRYKIVSAKLSVTHRVTSSGTFTRQAGETNPLEARALPAVFTEATWDFSDPANPVPSGVLYGNGSMVNYSGTTSFVIPVDLKGAAFETDFNAAVNGTTKSIAVALTSKMPVSGMEGALPYRIFSRENSPSLRPKLEIVFKRFPSWTGPFGQVFTNGG